MIASMLLGRMGNHLFEYSFSRYVAEENGYDYGIVENNPLGDGGFHKGIWLAESFLDCNLKKFKKDEFQNIYEDINDGQGYEGKPFKVHNIKSIKDYTLCFGIYQSGDITNKINPDWFAVKNTNHNTPFSIDSHCYIHYRGVECPMFFENRNMTDHIKNYYKKAKEYILCELGKQINFVVITDDINSAKNYIEADHYMSNSSEDDFFTLSLAKYSVVSFSTFSWWASFLNKNREICIAPKNWYLKTTNNWCYTDKFTWI